MKAVEHDSKKSNRFNGDLKGGCPGFVDEKSTAGHMRLPTCFILVISYFDKNMVIWPQAVEGITPYYEVYTQTVSSGDYDTAARRLSFYGLYNCSSFGVLQLLTPDLF